MRLENNATFEVLTDGPSAGRFVLRIHRPGYRTVAHTRSELRFLQTVHEYLAGSDVEVPQPVPARDGRLVVESKLPASEASPGGLRHCDLLTWVAGDALVPGNGLGPNAVHSLGRALALLHNAAEQFEPPADFELPRWDADAMFTTLASPYRPMLSLDELLSPTDRGLFDEIADRTRAAFAALDAESGSSFGVIHCDYILGNCHLRNSGGAWRVGVIDFDDCGWSYFPYDLCPLLGNLAGYPGAIADNPAYPALRSAYLDGYRTARPLPAAWETHLPVLMAARNANHCLLTARLDLSPTPREDAAWRMDLARRCLELPSA
nr:phosphotransferase [Actinopolymorpha pittospori]